MKTREEALEYGLSFPGAYQEAPFHDPNWQLVRYNGNKKAFLIRLSFAIPVTRIQKPHKITESGQ